MTRIRLTHCDSNYYPTKAVRKIIITEKDCKIYIHNRKSPIIFKDLNEVVYEAIQNTNNGGK